MHKALKAICPQGKPCTGKPYEIKDIELGPTYGKVTLVVEVGANGFEGQHQKNGLREAWMELAAATWGRQSEEQHAALEVIQDLSLWVTQMLPEGAAI
jgi:hypothetical protein